MEANIINLEKNEDRETIKKLVSELTKQININQIYLINGDEESRHPYRLIIIIEDMAKRFKQRVKEILEESLQEYPMYYAQFFTLHYIQNITSEGNTFFLNHCSEERLIYYHHNYDVRWLFHNVDFTAFIIKARANFLNQEEKILNFKKGADLFLENMSYGHAAFMLHQTIEHSFLAAEYFLMGKTFTGHLISDHQIFIGNIHIAFKNIFPRENEMDTNLLNKLNKAYCDTRYSLNYQIREALVLEIKKRAEDLIHLVNKYVQAEVLKCERSLQNNPPSHPIEKEDIQIDKKKNSNDEDDRLLKKIKKLGKENFMTMRPIQGIRGGYYLNYARVYDYLDLFALLQSTLNVCILALEEQQDCRLDIKNKEEDVKAVLGFAKNLIPLEEATFLDKMRKLIQSTEKNG